MGRHSLHVQTYLKCMKYLVRTREVTDVDILHTYTTAWIRKMMVGYRHEHLLKENWFGTVRPYQGVGDETTFTSVFKHRLT